MGLVRPEEGKLSGELPGLQHSDQLFLSVVSLPVDPHLPPVEHIQRLFAIPGHIEVLILTVFCRTYLAEDFLHFLIIQMIDYRNAPHTMFLSLISMHFTPSVSPAGRPALSRSSAVSARLSFSLITRMAFTMTSRTLTS